MLPAVQPQPSPSQPEVSPQVSNAEPAPEKRTTPRWLRLLLSFEAIVVGGFLIWSGSTFPYHFFRTELTTTLVSDALLVFLIVIAIDGFDRRSITRDQRWLLKWIARPTTYAIFAALLTNLLLPITTGDDLDNSPEARLLLSVPWALILYVLVMAITLTCIIAVSRLDAARRPSATG